MAPSPPQPPREVLPFYTRQEVAEHKKFKDCWVVINGEVYDVTRWLTKHPGGGRILMHYAGEDATVSSSTQFSLIFALRGSKEGGACMDRVNLLSLFHSTTYIAEDKSAGKCISHAPKAS